MEEVIWADFLIVIRPFTIWNKNLILCLCNHWRSICRSLLLNTFCSYETDIFPISKLPRITQIKPLMIKCKNCTGDFGRCWQWRSQPKNLVGAKMLDFRRITLFCWEKRLSKHKMTIFSKNLGGAWPLCPPWLRLWLLKACREIVEQLCNGSVCTVARFTKYCFTMLRFLPIARKMF